MKSTSVPKPSIGDNAKGKQAAEGDLPSGTLPLKESNIQREETALSSSKIPTGGTSRRESAEVPKNTLDDFGVLVVWTPYGKGSFNPSRLFSWIADLGLMLDEIWSEESFQEFCKEPLQADNREGMRMLSKVRLFFFFYFL